MNAEQAEEEPLTETELAPNQVAQRLEGDDVQLIDVREDYEWNAGRIAGAHHIPLTELSSRAAELDRDRPLVLYCRAGSRSGMAAEALRSAGYDAYNVAGGLKAWADEGLPLDPEDGIVADRSTLPPA